LTFIAIPFSPYLVFTIFKLYLVYPTEFGGIFD